MSARLPALRGNLDVMPSPLADQPGLLLRDPYRFAEATLVIPPPLVPLLALFDGRRDDADAKAALVRATGDLRAAALLGRLQDTLSSEGFLEDEAFARRRDERRRRFAQSPRREAAHAGTGYPAEAAALRAMLDRYLAQAGPPGGTADGLVGVAAPHVSPEGGSAAYAAAYSALPSGLADRTFVVLGTSHYGEPRRFGLTRKPFATPLGETRTDPELQRMLEQNGGPALVLEDYCHAVEHSIEFQVIFLQHLFGAGIRVLPMLCGPLPHGREPESDEGVARLVAALADAVARSGERLVFVLGVDMAHVGRRYGDRQPATAHAGALAEVEQRDLERCARLAAGDAAGFWRLLGPEDDLRWCGAAPFYVFLRVVGGVRGELMRYDQWNIDEASVVSFAGMRFFRSRGEP